MVRATVEGVDYIVRAAQVGTMVGGVSCKSCESGREANRCGSVRGAIESAVRAAIAVFKSEAA
jgi:hypothetical protein